MSSIRRLSALVALGLVVTGCLPAPPPDTTPPTPAPAEVPTTAPPGTVPTTTPTTSTTSTSTTSTTTTTTSSTLPAGVAPVVTAFTAGPSAVVAPAVVALAWQVSDPQGDALTCTLDGNGDGSTDLTVSNCQAPGSRNVSLPTAGTVQSRLTVTDGTNTTQATTTVTVSAGSAETFDILLRPVGALDPPVQSTFDAAVARWEQILVRGVPDLVANLPGGACLAGSAPIAAVDDLVIDVQVTAMDGPGGVLGSAGPCFTSGADGLPRVGLMQFDSADVAGLLSAGQLDEVILHEMAHVLGFGTIWQTPAGLVSGFAGSDPRFLGPRSVAAWSTMGRSGSVPVEADGGAGTAYSHWDETTMAKELMTGWLNSGVNPLSALSIASLADLGYRVDLAPAEPYSPPSLAALRIGADLAPPSGGDDHHGEVLVTPRGSI